MRRRRHLACPLAPAEPSVMPPAARGGGPAGAPAAPPPPPVPPVPAFEEDDDEQADTRTAHATTTLSIRPDAFMRRSLSSGSDDCYRRRSVTQAATGQAPI